MKVVSIRLQETLWQDLTKYCRLNNYKRSALIRMAIRKLLWERTGKLIYIPRC